MANATATKVYSDAELMAVLHLGKTEKVDFVAADIPTAALTALGQAYLNLVLAKNTAFPFGRSLQQFADAQIKVVRAAIAAA